MEREKYQKRLIDKKLTEYLEVFGGVCVEGPKFCGKTWTSSYHSKSEFSVGDPTNNFSNRKLAEIDPYSILKGSAPRLIDEWQEVPSIWDATRSFLDQTSEKGQIILTGSSTPTDKGEFHSGVGRIATLRMNTMSLYESSDSTGAISLRELIEDNFTPQIVETTPLTKLAYLIVRGGWPQNRDVKEAYSHYLARSYMEGVFTSDIHKIDKNVRYSSHIAELILRSLARNEATTASNQSILNDISENDKDEFSKTTLAKYLDAFERMFLLNNQKPFAPNIRSSLRVKQMEKRHFSDPAMACAMLGVTPKKLMGDMNLFGFMFESLAERDLGIYAFANNAKLFHYQDYKNNEIDAVIELENGDWCAFEIKLGLDRAEEGAANLNRVCKAIVDNGGKAPKLKCILYGFGNMACKTKDGVYIIPLCSLKD